MENIIKDAYNIEAVKVSNETKDLIKCRALLECVFSYMENKIKDPETLDSFFKNYVNMANVIGEEVKCSFIRKMEETNFKEI